MRAILVVLLLLGAAGLFADAAVAERRIALVVGNATYDDIPPLQNPLNDAELMAETLALLGFEVNLVTNANRRDMARKILDFGYQLSRAGPDAVGLFYYAGHGVQARGTNYLLPLESRVDTEADLEIEAIDANWVLGQMDEAGNDLNIVILDACRNNPFEGSFRSSVRGLARLDAPAGSIIAYSAAPGQTAVDGEGKNSPYTRSLADAMLTPGVELLQVFRRVRVDVEKATNGRQTPWEEQSLRTDFYFAPVVDQGDDEEQVAVVVPEGGLDPAPPGSGDQQSGGVQYEILFWNSVKDSGDPDILQTYLNRYPDGVFAGLASVMIDRLRSERGEPEAEPGSGPDAGPGDDTPASDDGEAPGDTAEPGDTAAPGDTPEPGEDDETFEMAAVDPDAADDVEPEEDEREAYPELPRDIQQALSEVGCSPGPIDGIWGRRSQRALDKFAQYASVELPEEGISVATLEMIEAEEGRVCPLVCGRREVERNGRCVTKTCPSGQVLNSAGNCVARQAGGSGGGSSGGSTSHSPPAQSSPGGRECPGATVCCHYGGQRACVGAGACITRYLGTPMTDDSACF